MWTVLASEQVAHQEQPVLQVKEDQRHVQMQLHAAMASAQHLQQVRVETSQA